MPDSVDGSLAPAAGARHDRRELVQALRTIERLQEALATAGDRAAPPGPVAVTGIGCRFPGGVHDPESFWRLLCDGVDATGEFPAARADAAPFYDADPEAPGKAHVIRGGFLSGPVDRFEPAVFGISPREAVGMDPQQRLTLEVAWEALERSGYAPDGLEGSATGVFLGVSTTDYVRLRQQIGDIRHVDAYQLIGEPSFMAGRISYTLGLMGPSKVVDTACSSSLVALHDACQALRLGECDMALAGGVNLMLAPYGFVLMSKFRALSADGRCKTFDASADGYGRGEGAGIVVLKRLADAQAAGDPVLAVIRGTAVNHDGRSSGLSVPNPASQQAVLRQALAAARAEPSEIGYVEAHGTGTALGDPIELRALEAVIGRHHANGSPLLVGSVKTNVGHLESAAGAAGLIKLILCLQHGKIPPHLHYRQPNPNVDWDRLHIDVTSTSRRWPAGPRVGGVSSFGASGTNAHAIVSEPPPRPAGRARRNWNVFTLSARTQDSLRESAARHAAHLDDHPDIPLADLCYTTQVGRPRQRHGLAVVADSPRLIQSQLHDYASGGPAATVVLPQARHRKVCWLFTGQGAQRAGMARELRDEPAFRQAFDRCAGLLDQDLDQPLESVLWPDPGQPSPIGDTRYTQPALFALEYALAQLWAAWGIRPSVLLGHSVGEIAAACVAGVFRLEDAAALVSIRARLMSALPPGGAMAAVTGDEQAIQQALAGHQDVAIAGVNGPDEVVLSGAAGELDAVIEELGRLGVRASRLAVSHAFHSPLIGPVLGEFREAISGLNFAMPRVPLVSNVTGRLWTAQEVGPDYWVRHAASPVLFRAGARAVHEEGVRTFLELGPAPVLCGLAARGISDPDAEFIPSLRPGTSDLQVLAQAAGLLSLRGARVDWPAFHGGDQPRRVTLPSTPWHGDPFWFKPAAPVSAAAGRLEGVGLRLRGARPTYELSPDDGAWARRAHVCESGQADLQLGALTAAAIAAAGDGLGGSWHCAEGAALPGTVLRHQGLPQTVQLSVLDVGDDQAVCEFRGITEAEEKAGAPWRLVARTALRRRPAAAPRRRPLLDPARYPQRRPVDSAALPAASADAIDQVLASDRAGDVLVALVPGAAGWAAIADAATAAMAWAGSGDPPARMAAGLAGMSCADPARVRYVRGRSPERGTAGRAEFFDADGAWLGGAHATPPPAVPGAPASEPWRDPAELLYRVDWPEAAGPSPAPDLAARLAGQGYLLFADRDGAAESFAGQLRSAGATADVAPVPLAGASGTAGGELVPDAAAVGEVLDSWLAATPDPARVVVCTGLDAPALDETTREAIEEFTARADLLVITLTQQLAARPRRDPVRVTLLTRGAVAAEPAQAGHSPLAATCWGLGRVLALEHPDHWGGLIDLDPAIPAVKSARLLEALVHSPADDEQALRGDRRLVSRLAPAPVPGPAPGGPPRREPPVRPDGTYLITGAFGGIGVALAHWLGRAGAGRLVLLARTRLPARSRWDGELEVPVRSRVEAVRSLERLGVEVEVVACDVTDEAAMTRLFRKLRDGRRPLRGVVHAAGVSAPQFVRDVQPEAYRAVWRPKVIGGWLTHRLSEGAPLDFFLGFSSIAATWGSQHLASYAAGNAFLTGLAHQRAAAGNPGLAVEWGPWASSSGLFGEDVMEFLKSTGLRPLAPDQCLHLLGALLDSGEPHHVVCAADWSVFKPVMEARIERPLLAGLAVDGSPEAAEPTELRAELLAAGDEGPSSAAIRGGLLSGYLRAVGAEILGVAPDEIDPEADLMDGGLDSVMVMDVVRRCKRDLGLAVKASKLFERTTLEDWVDLLMEQFGWARDPAGRAPAPASTTRPCDAGTAPTAPGPGPGPAVGDPADPAWLARDVTLDPRIRPDGPAPVITAPHDILLTGSTGFIGAYLLSELLAATPATVHCLVRCGDAAEGRQRIRDNFARYLPWPAAAEDRIRVIRADLSEPMLGLTAEEFSALAGRIDAIVHNGAWVNFSYTYEQLRPANVRGTQEILRLACHAAPIPVHHVSTYGIWGLPAGQRTVIGEDDDITGAGRLVTGYVQSKWAAERLVELARERGVGVNVYRPGRVLGDSRTGACLTTHFTTRVIKGCVELGIAPQIDLDVEMTPVDYVAAAMVGIAFSGRPPGAAYHLVNGRKMRFSELIAVLRRRGWPVTPVPVQTWWDALRRSYGERPNELHPVMDVVEEFVVGGEEAIDYAVANTESALDGTGIGCPPLDERLLRLYLDWMSARGYLPVPRHDRGAEQP
jgi:thioester reductase-like protein